MKNLPILLMFLSILVFSLFHLGEPFNLSDYKDSKIDSLIFECKNKRITISEDSINTIEKFCELIKQSEKIQEGWNKKAFGFEPYKLTVYFKNKSIDKIDISHNKKNDAKMLCNVGVLNDYYYLNYELYLFVASKLKCEK